MTETVDDLVEQLDALVQEAHRQGALGVTEGPNANPEVAHGEHLIDIDHEHRVVAHALNHEASQLALQLFPDDTPPWPTDEPMPDLRPMWQETARLQPHHRPYVEDFDSETLPLFENWIANIERLHPTEENT